MGIAKDEVTKLLELDLTDIPEEDQDRAKRDVLDYIKEQILADLSAAKSPVTGKAFVPLSKEYKKFKETQSSSPTANMELTGAMLDALTGVAYDDNTIEVGWFDPDQAAKAYNHTVGDTVPQRELIPGPSDDFRASTMREIASILDNYRAPSN